MTVASQELVEELRAIVGDERVLIDQKQCEFFSSDVYSSGSTAAMVIRPGVADQLGEVVSSAIKANFAVIPRGGGMSYTGGYIPQSARSIILDLSDLNRIVEINQEDCYITVEAGVTWQQIDRALKPHGLRLPFFGTFSGSRATVGGGLSNGALFLGTARYGTAAEIVLALDVVVADGTTISTGQSGFANGRPFYRTYGPDLTGLFVHDAGALGIKTRATLRLIRAPAEVDFISFAFAEQSDAITALSEIARNDLTEEAYVFDPVTTANSLAGDDWRDNWRKLLEVTKGQSNWAKGLRDGAKLIAAGKDFIAKQMFSLHLVCAGRSVAAVAADLASCRTIAEQHHGVPIANSIPKTARADPFGPLNGILGPKGERWMALNAKVAHSDALATIDASQSLLAEYADAMRESGVTVSWLFIAISNHAFSVEPVFRWFDEWLPLHRAVPEAKHLQKLTEPEPNLAARQLVGQLRTAIVELFAARGAASNQIGKTYPYFDSLKPPTSKVIRQLKRVMDPSNLINPGALGLD